MGKLKSCGIFVVLVSLLLGGVTMYLRENKVTRGMLPLFMANQKFFHKDIPDLSDKVVIVTGANVGLGKSTAKYLAINGATTIMGCRSMAKCKAARDDILSQLPAGSSKTKVGKLLVPMELDLASLANIKAFVESFQKQYKRLDSLILNAGIMHTPYELTADGIESQFGVNHIGHFYLTNLLLPTILRTENKSPCTIVSVSSMGHHMAYPQGVFLTLKDINDKEKYDSMKAYGQAKLANILFAKELAARMQNKLVNVFVNAIHPGGVMTELHRHWNIPGEETIFSFMKRHPDVFMFEPDTAALTQLYAAVAPEIASKKISGKYFVPIADEVEPSDLALNTTLQKELWLFSEKILKEKGFSV